MSEVKTDNVSNFTEEQLKNLQSKSLEEKIQISTSRIMDWYNHWDGQVYVSFSGGKDSTVLLHLVRRIYPDVSAMYVDTGLEFPELREFVKTIDNVDWEKPAMNFIEVTKKYGYPVISKSVAQAVMYGHKEGSYGWKRLHGEIYSEDGKPSLFNCKKWCFLLDAPFKISNKCCDVMKKRPAHKYDLRTGKKPFLGVMTEESTLRKKNWLQKGCNAFGGKKPLSTPMAFWTEQDVLQYIKKYNLSYAPVYGDLIEDENGKLRFTGYQRTGCAFCGFGCHLEKEPNRFQKLKLTHPKLYDYCMRGGTYDENGIWVPDKGLGLDKVLKYIGVETDYEPKDEKEEQNDSTEED